MRISTATPEQRRDIIRRVARGYGELVKLSWSECNKPCDKCKEDPCANPENWETVSDEFYIGKMTPGQTGTILTIIVRAIINGLDFQKQTGRTDILSFINSLAGEHVNVLLGAILYEPVSWIDENFDPSWLLSVVGTFLAHNDFLTLLQEATKTATKFGLNLESLTNLTATFSAAQTSKTE